MSSTYTHDPLTSPNHIRLLELLPGEVSAPVSALVHQVQLSDDDDEEKPVYTALSYTWGPDVERDKSPVWLDGEPFLVRPNLLAALQTLRGTEEAVTMWVDAVCINQKDVYERNYQVGRMGRIYRAAKQVKVWLGVVDGQSEAGTAMEYIQSHGSKRGLDFGVDHIPEVDDNVPVEAVTALLRREYWSRAWIVQEVMLAARIDIHYGTASVQWDELVRACQPIWKHLPSLSATHLVDQRNALVKGQRPLLAQTLESLIKTYHRTDCSERRDRIFAFLPLASDCASGQGLKPDYLAPRLTMLVRVMEFCKPSDPIAFIAMLFLALTNSGQDAAWEKAAQHWNVSSQTPPASNARSIVVGAVVKEVEVVQVTHYVTASSTTRDWARFYSFPAMLDPHGYNDGSNIGIAEMLKNRTNVAGSSRYQDRVCKLDDSQVAVLLHEFHYIVFSTSRTMAAVSPCDVWGLHEKKDGCSFAHCGMLTAA